MESIYLKVYDRDLIFLGVIDRYSSLRWRRKYFETGEFELHIDPTKNNMKLLQYDNIIVRSDIQAEEFGIINSWQIDDDGEKVSIAIHGEFGLSLLKRRLLRNRITFNGTFINAFKTVLQAITPFNRLDIVASSIVSGNIDFQVTYKNVYKFHERLARASNIAGKITLDIPNRRYKYSNYIGLDRTNDQTTNIRHVFSEDHNNIDKAVYTYTRNNLVNWVLVGGQGEGTARILRTITANTGSTHDFDKREIFVDAKAESNDGLTVSEYNAVLDAIGREKLDDPLTTFEVVANPLHYRTTWNLGDIVTIIKESWGMQEKQRITEVEEIIENGHLTIIPTFGSPISEALGEEED